MNATQSANIVKLLIYLRRCVGKDIANKYAHVTFTTCTVGFAAYSGLFPSLNITARRCAGDGSWSLKYVGDITPLIRDCFGSEYLNNLVLYHPYVREYASGNAQLKFIITEIEKFLTTHGVAIPSKVKAKVVNPPNPETAGKRIEARIARMKKIVADIEKLGADAKHFTVDHDSMQAQIDMLNDALAS